MEIGRDGVVEWSLILEVSRVSYPRSSYIRVNDEGRGELLMVSINKVLLIYCVC